MRLSLAQGYCPESVVLPVATQREREEGEEMKRGRGEGEGGRRERESERWVVCM